MAVPGIDFFLWTVDLADIPAVALRLYFGVLQILYWVLMAGMLVWLIGRWVGT